MKNFLIFSPVTLKTFLYSSHDTKLHNPHISKVEIISFKKLSYQKNATHLAVKYTIKTKK